MNGKWRMAKWVSDEWQAPVAHLPGLLGKACLFMLRLLLPLERPKTSVYPILSQRTEYDGK